MKTVALWFCIAAFCVAADAKVIYSNGVWQLFAVLDQRTNMGVEILLNPSEEAAAIVAKHQNPSSINTFLLRQLPSTKGAIPTVLFDTGMHGALLANLASIGTKAEDVNAVLITHMHPDHIGGLIKDGKKVFANATVYLPENDLKHWLNSTDDNRKIAQSLQSVYGDRLKSFAWGVKPLKNAPITAIKAAGHTPGHTVFELADKNGKSELLIVADLIHSLNAQMAYPDQSVTFDTDPIAAAKTRREIFDYAAKNKIPIVGMHILFPSIGMITKDNNGYQFSPKVD
ncbi:MBL fold metallo-hydrolase [Campylobacterota bacterium]|nr:MBL fold metallo-hydrolase [Campylobacterota bacterium]